MLRSPVVQRATAGVAPGLADADGEVTLADGVIADAEAEGAEDDGVEAELAAEDGSDALVAEAGRLSPLEEQPASKSPARARPVRPKRGPRTVFTRQVCPPTQQRRCGMALTGPRVG